MRQGARLACCIFNIYLPALFFSLFSCLSRLFFLLSPSSPGSDDQQRIISSYFVYHGIFVSFHYNSSKLWSHITYSWVLKLFFSRQRRYTTLSPPALGICHLLSVFFCPMLCSFELERLAICRHSPLLLPLFAVMPTRWYCVWWILCTLSQYKL